MRRPMARLALLLLVAYLTRAVHGLRVVQLAPGQGQEFAQAVADFGSSGEDTTIYLPRGKLFSLANVSVVSAVSTNPEFRPFSHGVLTIMQAPGDDPNPTVLDAAMLAAINAVAGQPTPLDGTAQLRLVGITLINLCDTVLPLNVAGTLLMTSAVSMPLFARSRAVRAHQCTNVTIYTRQADISIYLYIGCLYLAPFPQVLARTRPLLQDIPIIPEPNAYRLFSSYSIGISRMLWPAVEQINTTFKSIADPFDPLLNTLKASGVLLPPRYCYRPGSPPLLVDPAQPLWIATDTESWMTALPQAINMSNTNGLPPMILTSGLVLPAAPMPQPTLPPLTGLLLLAGYTTDQPAVFSVQGTLDFSNQLSFQLPIAAGGALCIQRTTLKGLAAYPQSRSPTPSALPLAVFPRAEGSDLVFMDTVTLELPNLDYLALLALAQPSLAAAFNTTVRQHAESLKQGISVLSLAQLTPGYSCIILSAFTGWDINATNLNILPANTSILATIAVAAQQLIASQASSNSGLSTQQVGIIAGCSVAGLVVVCGAILAGSWILNNHTRDLQHQIVPFGKSGPKRRGRTCGIQAGAKAAAASELTHSWSHGEAPMDSKSSGRSLLDTPTSDIVQADSAHSAPPATEAMTSANAAVNSQTARALHLDAAPEVLAVHAMLEGSITGQLDVLQQHARALEPEDLKELAGFCGEQSLLSQRDAPEGDTDKVLVRLPHRDNPAASRLSVTSLGSEHTADGTVSSWVPSAYLTGTSGKSGTSAGDTESVTASMAASQHPMMAVAELVQQLADDKPNLVSVIGVLGHGSWGTVYSAEWRGLPVAIKTMVFEVVEDSDTAAQGAVVGDGGARTQRHEQVILEAAVATTVDHRNVVRTYYYDIQAVGSSDIAAMCAAGLQIQSKSVNPVTSKTFKLFLVQELCNTTLDAVLGKQLLHDTNTGLLQDVQTTLYLLLDVASGLQYLHSRNIVHGDLKPANVLLKHDARGHNAITAKLADFGLSACLTGGQTHVSNYRKGTPFYVSPEVVTQHRTSPASDIFSFGVLMWQCHTGQAPYQESAPKVFAWNPLFPNYKANNPPRSAFARLVRRCLLSTPQSRPTATEVVSILRLMASECTPAAG